MTTTDAQIINFLLDKVNARRKNKLTVQDIIDQITNPKVIKEKPIKEPSDSKPKKKAITKAMLLDFACGKLGTEEKELKEELKANLSD
jgi:hypothetical protein